MINIPVTTEDIRDEYDIIGPVYYQLSNKGLRHTQFSKIKKKREIYYN